MDNDHKRENLVTVTCEVAAVVGAYTPCVSTLKAKAQPQAKLGRVLKDWTKQAKPDNGWSFHRDQGASFVRYNKHVMLAVDPRGLLHMNFGHTDHVVGLELIYDGEVLRIGREELMVFCSHPDMVKVMLDVLEGSELLFAAWNTLKATDTRLSAVEECYRTWTHHVQSKEHLRSLLSQRTRHSVTA